MTRAFLTFVLAAQLLAGGQRVVYIGDSITALWDLPATFGKPYVNRGISGNTTHQMLHRFYQDVVEEGATTVVILGGINDIGSMEGFVTNEQIERNLAAMCAIAKARGIAVVLATLLPDRGTYLTTHPLVRIQAVNDWIRAHAAQERIVLLDYYPAMLGADGTLDATLTADDIHPNAAGRLRMAPLAEAAIAKTLGEGDR